MEKTPKKPKEFYCEECNFNCSNKKDYNRHVLTAKHQYRTLRVEKPQKTPKSSKIFECECGKIYKARNSLWYHKQRCNYTEETNDEIENSINLVDENEPTSDASTVLMLLKQNDEFKQLMSEQYSALMVVQKQNMELSKQMIDVVKDGTVINNTTNNNTTNNFNLNFFLNDTCKDAMNITDFLGNLDVQLNEIEYIGHHGYVNGMTKMIMERLKGMDITKRPIHCTDIKRETMYIKDKDEWSKDTDELTKLRKILNRVTMNNCKTIPKWKSAHPDCEIMETRNNEFCYKMMRLMLGDVEEAQIKLDNKIIKTMSKELYVHKNKV
jgi:hypothetical protein